MTAPWQCPECLIWLAPAVTEHRCDPAAGVPATLAPVAPTGGGTSGSATRMAGTVIILSATAQAGGPGLARAISATRHLRNLRDDPGVQEAIGRLRGGEGMTA